MKTLLDLYLKVDGVTSVTVYDDATGTEASFSWLFDALNHYGDEREVEEFYSDDGPDKNGHMTIYLEA